MPQVDDRLKRLKKLKLLPVEEYNIPAPPIDARSQQAADLEQQAQPAPGPVGAKQNLVAALRAGMQGFSNPRGYQQVQAQEQEQERQRQQDLYSRAKQVRESQAQDAQGRLSQYNADRSFNAGEDQRQFSRVMDLRGQDLAEQKAAQPVPFEAAAGTSYGTRDPKTGIASIQDTVTPKAASPKSLQAKDVDLKGGGHGPANYNPDDGTYRDSQGNDISANVVGEHHAPTGIGQVDTRNDRSFQYNRGALDKIQQPIEDSVSRLGRLQDTVDQGTPQADSVIAPELITVMAGGAGSGVRITTAEINSVLGGRSNLESLKAALNKWQVDPTKALSVTPAQRQQIKALMGTLQTKLTAKQQVLDEASDSLINANDPTEHRKIVADAKKRLAAIDQGGAQGGGAPVAASTGRVRVRNKKTGQTGTVSPGYDTSKYEPVQ